LIKQTISIEINFDINPDNFDANTSKKDILEAVTDEILCDVQNTLNSLGSLKSHVECKMMKEIL